MREVHGFTSTQVCEVAGVTRRQLQLLVESGTVTPVRKGRRGPGRQDLYSFRQVIALAYGGAFLAAGAHLDWAREAARFVARMHPGELLVELAHGRTLLVMYPERAGLSRFVDPKSVLSPLATREQRLFAARLDMRSCYLRVWRRAEELVVRLTREERAAAERMAREEAASRGG